MGKLGVAEQRRDVAERYAEPIGSDLSQHGVGAGADLLARGPQGRPPVQPDGEVRTWCAANRVDLVFLPTYASWLNWIEAEFAAVRYFALNGTDHRTHAEQEATIGGYTRWRNQPTRPKTAFATGSKIRHPDYPFKAA